MKIFNNSLLLLLLTFTLFTTNCSTDQREDILERYSSGAKYVVGIYKGTGTNETLIERHYFQENGKLGRIEKLEDGKIVNYLDLYPETKTTEGLKEFLKGTWVGINKVNHNLFDVYEVFYLTFDANDLQKYIQVILCDNDDFNRILPIGIMLRSKVDYKENLKVEESNIEFESAIPIEAWRILTNRYSFDKSDFSTTVYAELEKYRSQERNASPMAIDTTSFLGRLVKLDFIQIKNNSIGNTMIPFHGASVVDTDEWYSYAWETGLVSVLDLEFTRDVRTGSCSEIEEILSTTHR